MPSAGLLILAETEHLLAIEKPSGLSTLHSIHSDSPSLERLVQAARPAQARLPDSGVLYRLDLGTSGLILVAKDPETYCDLRARWKSPDVVKIYTALVSKQGLTPQSLLAPIGHDKKSKRRMRAVLNSRDLKNIRSKPQPAYTQILDVSDGTPSEIRLQIKTGVRHQIRVHLASAGYPILGDALYRGETAPRLMLHCSEILVKQDKDWIKFGSTPPWRL